MATKRICSVDGCGKPYFCLGFCVLHYSRYSTGKPFSDPPMITRKVSEDAYRQALSSATDECVIWPYRRNKGGYAVWGGYKHFSALVPRHMCWELHGPPPTSRYYAAHSCGKGQLGCVNPRHIVWKTPVANALDRYTHGTMTLGTDMWKAKLDPDKVREIRKLLARGVSNADIGEQFGVHGSTIWAILTRKTWTHVI